MRMKTVCEIPKSRREVQFSLRSLIEYVTVCAIVMAWSAPLGVAASVFLMLMGLALWARQGVLCLAMLMAACLAVDSSQQDSASRMERQLMVILLAGALCTWYRVRREYVSTGARKGWDAPKRAARRRR
jgi:hypothetical protein